jgi:hypothetical protein
MLRMCACMHSRFVENHPIRILEDGLLISKVILSQDDNAEVKRITRKSKMYHLIEGILYR